MKAQTMSEPISGAAAGVAGLKALGASGVLAGIGAGAAAFVVMAKTKPETDKEWRIALVSTVMGSIGGGGALVRYLGIQDWVQDPFGMMGMLGVVFLCGLPAWGLVRALFRYLDKRRDADLAEIVKEVKESIG